MSKINISLYYNCHKDQRRALNDQLQGAGCFSSSQLFSATQEIPFILRNPTVHYPVHNSPPVVPVRSNQSTPSRAVFRSLFYYILPSTSGSSSFRFRRKYPLCILIYTMHSTFPANLFVPGFIIRMINGYEHKPRSSCMQIFPVFSTLFPLSFN